MKFYGSESNESEQCSLGPFEAEESKSSTESFLNFDKTLIFQHFTFSENVESVTNEMKAKNSALPIQFKRRKAKVQQKVALILTKTVVFNFTQDMYVCTM